MQWGIVRLRDGEAGLPALRAFVGSYTDWPGAEVVPQQPNTDHARDVVRFEAGWLLAFGAVALLTALVTIGQVVARLIASSSADLLAMRALGMNPREGAVASAAGPGVAGVLGALAGVGLAIAASPVMPLGAAGQSEPSPGVDVDPLILPLGALVAVLLVGALGAGFGWLSGHPRSVLPARRPSVIATAAGGLPVPVTVGTRNALEPLPGVGAALIRSALGAAVLGVLGVVAAGTFGVAVLDAAREQARFGQFEQMTVAVGHLGNDQPGLNITALADAIRTDPDVVSIRDVSSPWPPPPRPGRCRCSGTTRRTAPGPR